MINVWGRVSQELPSGLSKSTLSRAMMRGLKEEGSWGEVGVFAEGEKFEVSLSKELLIASVMAIAVAELRERSPISRQASGELSAMFRA